MLIWDVGYYEDKHYKRKLKNIIYIYTTSKIRNNFPIYLIKCKFNIISSDFIPIKGIVALNISKIIESVG